MPINHKKIAQHVSNILLATFILTLQTTLAAQPALAVDKKPIFMAYYPTWVDNTGYNAFCPSNGLFKDYPEKVFKSCTPGSVLPDSAITGSALLAGGVPRYVTHVMLAFGKLNQMHQYTGLSRTDFDLTKLGIQFVPSSASIKEAIRVLKLNNPDTKVILALGGASYNDSWNSVSDADINQLSELIADLGLDGLDVDYEKSGTSPDIINEYYDSIKNMRKAVDLAKQKTGREIILTLAGWSVGASCSAEMKSDLDRYPQCKNKSSTFGSNLGRERLVLQGKGASTMIDAIGVMSYDASYENFDPVTAYHDYREIASPDAIVALGVQPAPDEGWGGARTLVDNRGIDNDCVGNTVLQDQYKKIKPGTFSIQRFAAEVSKHPGDGMMMWSLFSYRATSYCGSTPVSTVTEIGQGIARYLDLPESAKKIDKATADTYGR